MTSETAELLSLIGGKLLTRTSLIIFLAFENTKWLNMLFLYQRFLTLVIGIPLLLIFTTLHLSYHILAQSSFSRTASQDPTYLLLFALPPFSFCLHLLPSPIQTIPIIFNYITFPLTGSKNAELDDEIEQQEINEIIIAYWMQEQWQSCPINLCRWMKRGGRPGT